MVFAPYWSENSGYESGMVFEKTTGVYERFYRFISRCLKKKEKYVNKKYILLALNLKNDDIIS